MVICFHQAIRVLNGAKNHKKYTQEEYNLFVSKVGELTKDMNKAMNIPISSIAYAN